METKLKFFSAKLILRKGEKTEREQELLLTAINIKEAIDKANEIGQRYIGFELKSVTELKV